MSPIRPLSVATPKTKDETDAEGMFHVSGRG